MWSHARYLTQGNQTEHLIITTETPIWNILYTSHVDKTSWKCLSAKICLLLPVLVFSGSYCQPIAKVLSCEAHPIPKNLTLPVMWSWAHPRKTNTRITTYMYQYVKPSPESLTLLVMWSRVQPPATHPLPPSTHILPAPLTCHTGPLCPVAAPTPHYCTAGHSQLGDLKHQQTITYHLEYCCINHIHQCTGIQQSDTFSLYTTPNIHMY